MPAQINRCVKKLPKIEFELTGKVRKATLKTISTIGATLQDTVFIESGRKEEQHSGLKTQEDYKKFLMECNYKSEFRGTSFIGVSRNGKRNWQIISMFNGTKFYLGTVDNMLKAAILYDIFSIQTKGANAKTNFNYSVREVKCIVSLPCLIRIKNRIQDQKKNA